MQASHVAAVPALCVARNSTENHPSGHCICIRDHRSRPPESHDSVSGRRAPESACDQVSHQTTKQLPRVKTMCFLNESYSPWCISQLTHLTPPSPSFFDVSFDQDRMEEERGKVENDGEDEDEDEEDGNESEYEGEAVDEEAGDTAPPHVGGAPQANGKPPRRPPPDPGASWNALDTLAALQVRSH